MNRSMMQALAAAALTATALGAAAQKPIIYPAKGQSAQQQKKDEGECYVWAKNNTGIDPAALASAPPPPPPGPSGAALKGAARGAVVGEVVNDNPGGGAAAGAVVGAARGAKKAQAQQQQQAQAKQQTMATYNRAYGACLEGRGYTAK
jgi:hypothetical protein